MNRNGGLEGGVFYNRGGNDDLNFAVTIGKVRNRGGGLNLGKKVGNCRLKCGRAGRIIPAQA